MTTRRRPRPVWDELPGAVRAAAEHVLGAPVVASGSLPGIRAYQRAQGETVLAWLIERRPDLR